ncbi:magnesium transporter [Tistlia consotensis]|uniref:Magnesium transport protein CorA n=1 Tax=Tistlia consotensis USBA 355 TaxID=560819 RepID=A0A1Y6B3B2_9PROT|nr:magnesium transporter CorA family protein [Tistlia consotensis]SME89179.1 magnesium transporter [Tistlia consotensis USBA 355]SNR25740.1 magnesium transporter [Tistlia consotensis]
MIHVYRYRPAGTQQGGDARQSAVERVAFETGDVIPEDAVWIDVMSPDPEERQALESALWMFLPTREEASEIEPSSRLYREGDAIYVTVSALVKSDSDEPQTSPISFVLAGRRLLTLRYSDPMPFKTFAQYLERNPESCAAAQVTLAGLLDALIDRVADVLELQGGKLDKIGCEVFEKPDAKPGTRDYTNMLGALGRVADLTGKARESLSTIERALLYVSTVARQELTKDPAAGPEAATAGGRNGKAGKGAAKDPLSKTTQVRLKTLVRDVETLSDYTNFLSGKADFLLNAVLGLIANEQNGIIKIISVVSVIIMPPTLIASIYGMNFHDMPELGWPYGYPAALLVMLITALIPYLIFKRRGWL